MAERTLLTERIQLGFEATPGVAGTVNRRLLSANIDFSPDGDVDAFRPSGSKFAAISTLGREWSAGDLEGKPTYDEMYVWLCLNLGVPTTTTPDGATLARQHVWPIKASDPQEPRTATLERGSAVRAQRALHFFLNSIGLEYSRAAIDLSGDVVARAIEDGHTMTSAGITNFPLIPVLPKDTSVYLDDALNEIGTTKLLRALEAEWTLGNRFGQVWPINAALPSFAAIYETEPDAEVNLTLEADAAGMALLPVLREGDMRYVRIESIGPLIEEGGENYSLICDFAVKAREMPSYGDEEDLMTIEWPFGMFVDGAWGTGQVGEITLINTTAAIAGTP